MNSARSWRTPSTSVVSNARFTACLAKATATGDSVGDPLGDLQRLGQKLVGREHARNEIGAFGLGGVHHPRGQDHVHRLRLAHRAGQPLGATGAGQNAEIDLRLAELRGIGGEDEVAHHRQLAAAAQRKARDRGDHRLLHAQHRLPALADEVLQRGLGIGAVLHLLDVGAGREGLLVAGQHDRADRRIGVERQQLRADLVHHRVAQRVQRRGRLMRINPTRPWVSTMMFCKSAIFALPLEVAGACSYRWVRGQ